MCATFRSGGNAIWLSTVQYVDESEKVLCSLSQSQELVKGENPFMCMRNGCTTYMRRPYM